MTKIKYGTPRTRPQPRYIKPETICIGDTLSIRYTEGDTIVTRVGTVTERDQRNGDTYYYTALGFILLAVLRTGETAPPAATITLLDRVAPNTQPQLSGFQEII